MEQYGPGQSVKIAHISDIHVGSNHFVSNLLNRAVLEINEMEPDVVLVSGDLTNEGFRQQYSAVSAYLRNIECKRVAVIPGNHDSRNVGYVHFEDLFGSRNSSPRETGSRHEDTRLCRKSDIQELADEGINLG